MEFANGSAPSQTSTLARAEKALVKRNVNRVPSKRNLPAHQLDENSAAHDAAVSKKARKQPKGYAFWALVFALSVIALCNFFLTVTIFSVLRLTKTMEAIEVVPSANLIKFFGEFELNKLFKADGIISGFNQSPITVTSHGTNITLKVQSDNEPEIAISLDRVEFLNVNSFEITEPAQNPAIPAARVNAFSTIFPNFGLPKGVQRLHIKKATVNRITSGLQSPLLIRSENTMKLKGNEGINIKGRGVIVGADQDLLLRSINGSIILDGVDGILLDVNSMPIIAQSGPIVSFREDSVVRVHHKRMPEYKLCVCMPAGLLFRIPVLEGAESIQCDSVDLNSEDNPCVI